MSAIELAGVFYNPLEALYYASEHSVEFAILNIEISQMNGLELAKRLRALRPDMIIIFVSRSTEYIVEALKLKADYYVLMPYTREDIVDALERAVLLSHRQKKQVVIRTFGRFDVFMNDKLIKFTNAKSKELLALCVDRMGGEVSMEEAIDKLWPDKNYDNRVKALYRKAVIGIHHTIAEQGMPGIFYNRRGSCCLVDREVECDYYLLLKNRDAYRELYQGEYMFEYSWAEETNALLLRLTEY